MAGGMRELPENQLASMVLWFPFTNVTGTLRGMAEGTVTRPSPIKRPALYSTDIKKLFSAGNKILKGLITGNLNMCRHLYQKGKICPAII